MCDVLKEIYRKVYDESFDYNELSHRIKLQKEVYILENMGIYVGNYSFSWNKYGPYSLGLDSDAQKCSSLKEHDIVFSDLAEKAFEKIREYIKERTSYDCVSWMECIASLHFLKNVLRYSDDVLIEELQKRKPYLSDLMSNQKAMLIMKDIKVGF